MSDMSDEKKTKVCNYCKVEQPLNNFAPAGGKIYKKRYLQSYCRACGTIKRREDRAYRKQKTAIVN